MDFFASRASKSTLPIHVVAKKEVRGWLAKQDATSRNWLKSQGDPAKSGSLHTFPGKDGRLGGVLVVPSLTATPWNFAALPGLLPEGRYEITGHDGDQKLADVAAMGWAFGCYEFDLYKDRRKAGRELVWPAGCDRPRVKRLVESTFLVRRMITTPASDMLPADIEAIAKKMGRRYSAKVSVIRGDNLLTKGYPAVHAVGRASVNDPLLIDLRWGSANHPKVTIVGKGVCFDTGGLDLKPASGMLLMKKDMGGSAHALALGQAVMDAGLPVRLRVLVPAVENSIGGNAFRPLDVLETRKGLRVEVGNTDAEGRLILCDALAAASEEKPDLIIDFATLTGAARVALGYELPALFSNDGVWAERILESSERVGDPLWRMPLHGPYERFLKSSVADLSNIGSVSTGGAITAALFLQRFVDSKCAWVHVDQMAWNIDTRPGRPKGGEAMGLRAIYDALANRYKPTRASKSTKKAAKKKTAKRRR